MIDRKMIKDVIVKSLELHQNTEENITENSRIQTDLGIDSLDSVEVEIEVQNGLDFEFDCETNEMFFELMLSDCTVRELIDYLN